MKNALLSIAVAFCAVQALAETHTVKFRRLNGTVFREVQVEHGGSVALPSAPAETHFAFKGWDHAEWLSCVTNDFNVYALYENDGSITWPAGTGYGSKSIAERDEPYSLDEYFRMYDNVAWADEFSRGTNKAVAVNSSYWKYDTENRYQLTYETSGENQVESNGCLTISIRRESTPRTRYVWGMGQVEYDFTAGGIRSDNRVAFKHGRCEIRAKLTRQRGAWPAFWMMGNSGQWPACGELDVLEQPSGGDWIAGTLHVSPKNNKDRSLRNSGTATPEDGVHVGDGFHRYGTIINEREIIWYMDDHIFKRMDVRDSRYNMVRDRPWFILLGMGLQTNTWVRAPDAPIDRYDVPELVDHVDYLVDYCRIYTNTNANNTIPHVPSVPGAKLSAPVNATVWRGWDMNWGMPGSGTYTRNASNGGYGARNYFKTAMSRYLQREKTDFIAFLTNPTIAMEENRGQFDIPGYTMMSLSANANDVNNAENGDGGQGSLQLYCGAMFNTDRFSVSDSGVDLIKLSDDVNFTNCYAVCGDLVEKATGARVKVVAVNVVATNGVQNSSGTVANGFNALFTRLNAIKGEHVVLFFQGMDKALYNYIKAQADSKLKSPYSYLGNASSSASWQCAYATANASASASKPATVSVVTPNRLLSYPHGLQALKASVTFDALDEGCPDAFVESDYSKALDVTFSGYSGSELANFPVLVKLSTDIAGFRYSDFLLPGGGDLRFTDAAGNLLAHEIDTWNEDGVSTAWVKVPSLAKDVRIVAHYGCAKPVRPLAEKVWDSDYVGVWHLGESALPLKESSGKSEDFAYQTGKGVGYAASGIVGGALDFPSGGLSNAVIAADSSSLDNFPRFTLEAWTKQTEHKSGAGILSKRRSSSKEAAYYMQDNVSSTLLYIGTNNSASVRKVGNSVKPGTGEWAHQVYSVDMSITSSNVRGYLNGVAASPTSTDFGVSSLTNTLANLCVGNLQANGSSSSFNGQIDEVRISKTVRSAEWIKATHDTVANANFATYSFGEEPPPEPPDPPQPSDSFAKAVKVAFTGYSGGSALTDFPVLVKLSTAIPGFSYSDFQIENGGDLRFFDAAGNQLAHEIDTWNPSGVSTVWVKVPTLSASTTIMAQYGCEEPPENDPNAVWSNGYVGVWHMDETTRKQSDSTSSGKTMEGHSTYTANMAYGADGVVGKGVEQATPLDAEGKYRGGFQASDTSGLYNDTKTLTVEMWGCQREIVNDKYIVRDKTGSTLYSGRWSWSSGAATTKLNYTVALTNLAAGTGTEYTKVNYSVQTNDVLGTWRHYALVIDNETLHSIEAYHDGTSKKTQSILDADEALVAGSGTLAFGGTSNGGTQTYPGTIDELRVSRVARSADWVKATYETVMKPDFATYTMVGGGTLSGYAAWASAKSVGGKPADETNGIANGIRYAFDIAPEVGPAEIGTPIIKVVFDSDGHPSVAARDLAEGRTDVVFSVLATTDLSDWSQATLVPMEKVSEDGLWKPVSNTKSGYAYPAQLFFRYSIDVR